MRPILVVSSTEPTTLNHGALMRLRLTVEALAELADVELAIVDSLLPPDSGVGGLRVSRAQRFPPPDRRDLTLRARLRWFLQPSSIPLNLVGLDYSKQRKQLAAWLSEYSLVWVIRTNTYCAIASILPRDIPVVVDIDDLESEKLRLLLAAKRFDARTGGPPRSLSTIASQIQGHRNVLAWRRLDLRVSRAVDAALVCSQDDALVLGTEGVEVVPNSYPEPLVPLGRPSVQGAPTILLQGSQAYPANIDGAEFFIKEILPRIRMTHPDVSLRLVGKTSERSMLLKGTPNVEVVGFVPQIEDELQGADLIIAPIRFGGGTRIKIIEAFAHRIPVVSTTIGAHGLGAIHGTHLLLADSADAFADACVNALGDDSLRERLSINGRILYENRYREEVVKASFIKLAQRLHDSTPKEPG